MGQFVFMILFIITLIVGGFAYFAPSKVSFDPMKFVMDKSGYTAEEDTNRKRSQQLNMITTRGLMEIRKQIDDIALEQNKFLDTVKEQELVLKDSSKQASDVMLLAQKQGQAGQKDILQLQALATEMQDQQRLLVDHGKDLVNLNGQLTKNRQWVTDQMDLVNLSNDAASRELQQRYTELKNQADMFFDKVAEHNQIVRDQMLKMQDRMHDLANNAAYDSAVQQDSAKERMQRILDKEHEDMIRLADSEERSRNLLKDAQANLDSSKQRFIDSLQHSQEMMEEQRQKNEDQNWLNQQRIADQMQRLKDQQNR